MFKFYLQPFDDIAAITKEMRHASMGAFVSFEGWVRDSYQNKIVVALEYEALVPLCESESERIFAQVKEQFGVDRAVCLHRLGRLSAGEMSVWVGVCAAHRDEAFKACRYIIDELKKRLPIWKKEIYSDGSFSWVSCQQVQKPILQEKDYYARQIILPDIGDENQNKLRQARVLVVGAGGLGSAALMSLAQVGIGTIGIVEFDVLQASNLHRQLLYSAADLGKMKVDLAAERLKSVNPFVRIIKYPQRFDAKNFAAIISNFDILLDCTDNFAAKFLLNDIAVLAEKTLIQASIYQFEGQIRVYSPLESTACLRCLWPQIPPLDCVGNCAQSGVVGVVASVLGHLQAWETIKWLLKFPDRLCAEMLIVDLRNFTLRKIKEVSSSSCPLCGRNSLIKNITPENYMMSNSQKNLCVDLTAVCADQISHYIFVDVREKIELMMSPVAVVKSVHLPASQFGNWNFDFAQDKSYLLFCAHGLRSLSCVEKLHAKGIVNVQSVNDGVTAVNQYFSSRPKART